MPVIGSKAYFQYKHLLEANPRYMPPKQKPGHSRQDYQTPPEFLRALKHRLRIEHFTCDLAASRSNTVAELYYTEADNALLYPWRFQGWCFCNPPYADIEPWVRHAWEEAEAGHIAMLVPASTGANWWRDWVHDKAHVLLLNGRLTFVGETTSYPKDSALLLYTPYIKGGYEVWDWRAR